MGARAVDVQSMLTDMLLSFCREEDIVARSADELLHEDLTDSQRRWISAFIALWEASEDLA